jgi:peptide/nickel transport system substrate-binding protein
VVQGKNTLNIEVLGFNQAINTAGLLDPGVPSTFFQDINVRKAFASAFNYSDYLKNALGGSAIQPNGVIPAGMYGYNASIPMYSYDLQAAADYLKNATNPENGSSYAVTGFTINLFYDIGDAPNLYSCQLLKAGLTALNTNGLITGHINVTITGMDWQSYFSAMRTNQMPILFLTWAPSYADPDDVVNPFIDSSGAYATWCGIANDSLTTLSRMASGEQNSTLRAGMYSNISMQVYQNAYYIGIDQATNFHVERAWVTGYYYNPMYCGFYYYSFDKSG